MECIEEQYDEMAIEAMKTARGGWVVATNHSQTSEFPAPLFWISRDRYQGWHLFWHTSVRIMILFNNNLVTVLLVILTGIVGLVS